MFCLEIKRLEIDLHVDFRREQFAAEESEKGNFLYHQYHLLLQTV